MFSAFLLRACKYGADPQEKPVKAYFESMDIFFKGAHQVQGTNTLII